LKFGTWNVRSLYSAGELTAAGRELARYKLDLLGVQEFTGDKGGTVTGDIFFYVKETKIISWEQDFFKPQNNNNG
jgi:hypothetical protein